MNHLLNVLNSTDPRAVLQTNMEKVDAWIGASLAVVQGGTRFDSVGNLWVKCGDTLYRQIVGVLVNGVQTLTLGDVTHPSDWNPSVPVSLGGVRFDTNGDLWLKCSDNLYRKLVGTLVDGVAALILSDETQA